MIRGAKAALPVVRPARGGARGFTLLEMLAVLLLIGLVASLALPNLGALSEQRLRDEARRLRTELERARERSVVTGIRHRIVLDLDLGEYWTEWEPRELAEPPTPAAADSSLVDMEPPLRERRDFEPLPDRSGRATALAGEIIFEGVETGQSFVDRGVFRVPFEADGSCQGARIVLSRPEGDTLTLELLPLAETVRILDEEV